MDLIARPSPLRKFNCGAPSEVPFLPGIVFPYFENLLEPDFTFVGQVMMRHFAKAFGVSIIAQQENIPGFLQGCRAFANTEAGQKMSHVLIGVELAISSQSMLYVVVEDGEYLGFVLLGGGFRVYHQDKPYEPSTATIVQKEVSELSTHRANLRAIALILSSWTMKDAKAPTPTPITDTDLDQPRKLVHEFNIRNPATDNQLSNVTTLSAKLSYPQIYWMITRENIIKSTRLILQGGIIPTAEPMFLFDGFLETSKQDYRVKSVLALFGARPWSIMTGGTTFHFKPIGAPDNNLVMNQAGKFPLQFMCVVPKVFTQAVSDFVKLRDEKLFTVKAGRMSGAQGTKFVGDVARSVYSELKTLLFTGITEMDEVEGTKKRKTAPSASVGGMFGFKKRKLEVEGVESPKKKSKKVKSHAMDVDEDEPVRAGASTGPGTLLAEEAFESDAQVMLGMNAVFSSGV
jgi:hypothetical protein